MPLQIYERELILRCCRDTFACQGYKATSASMLAEAAGISKALIFHHFGSKKQLYLSILDSSMQQVRAELTLNQIPGNSDFFDAVVEFSRMKFEFYIRNPSVYKILMEALYTPPEEVKAEITARYPTLKEWSGEGWRPWFERVQLKDGVNRENAFELIVTVIRSCGERFLIDISDISAVDKVYETRFLDKLTSFLTMIRDGIEQREETK